ncbi:hypothetical protein CJF32_00003402 [Rutstroemia sp. NJR-2017a WRK4]|nr:hypothetical protein CJF32_00003402 [Rutstroemia sp. NJR-2017a WRK4]
MLPTNRKLCLVAVLCCNLGIAFASTVSNTITAPAVLPTQGQQASTPELQRGDPAIACWSSWSIYRSSSTSSYMSIINLPNSTDLILPTYIETYYNIETVDYSSATFTKLCPGVLYSWLTERVPTTTLATSYSTYYNYSTWYPQSVTRTDKPPACTYSRNSPQCSKLWSSWSSSSSALSTATDSSQALATIKSDGLPPCSEPEVPCPAILDRECTVKPDAGTLYYWPVTTVSGDFCAQNGSTVTPTPTRKGHPNTVVLGDMTFTSPSAYLVVRTLNGQYSSAGSGLMVRYGKCGPTVADLTLTLPPSAVSSVEFKYPQTGYPVNYADFNTVPVEPFKESCPWFRGCTGWGGSGIKNYQPFLQVPHEVLRAQKQWKNCTGWGWVRPSLKALEVEARTTGSGGQTSTARPSRPSIVAKHIIKNGDA